MIKKLRWRVAAITIAAVFTVLVVLMGIINISNYVSRDRASDEILQVLKENGGKFPDSFKKAMLPPDTASSVRTVPMSTDASSSDTLNISQKDNSDPGNFKDGRKLNPETPFETRYFTVSVDKSGKISETNIGRIAAVTQSEAENMTRALLLNGKTEGYYGNYKYIKTQTDTGSMYIFLDCTRDLEAVNQFLKSSLLASSAVFLAISALVIALAPLMVRPIEESYRKQKSFITNAGHELKTPLSVIESCNDVIEMESGSSKWTEGIRSQVKRMSILTEDLVSLARLDEGYELSQLETVDMSELVREMTDPFILMAEQKGLKFETEVEDGIEIKGNRKSLSELVSLLSDNAVKYAKNDIPIKMSLYRKGRKAYLTTANSAEDLTEGRMNHFFDRFYRGDTSHSNTIKGYGIGLSMAQAIVQAHGGKIEASSQDGKVLKISVKLPVTV